ncbi:non-ribosomal peptide synthetase [Deinococcus roseus]|uniref:Carrier domain-containing protein n=1 Tax=Deinococcus roseus TaxID=392414 RepID=A0ABQ2D258_9DEIO|nr:non-ribosomal peptide synthetase [Deinococcus roseus]GGJ42832.1 hypothetical protein GCM10008938_31310 [Deinococcus roseus]
MDPLNALLTELSRLGVHLEVRPGPQLAVSAHKGRLSQDLLDRLQQHKAELLAHLSHRASPAKPLEAIVPDVQNRHLPFPLGDLQTAFLMGDSEGFELHVRPHYFLELEFVDLDVERYEQALNAALYRQRFNLLHVTPDVQLQILPEFVPLHIAVQDLRGLPDSEVQQRLQCTRQELSRKTLPLDHWPWLDCRISLYGENQARLHWNNNNFFSDGYGTFKLLSDTRRLYDDLSLVLPELTLSYRDCVLALENLEAAEQGQAARKYWLDRLPDLPGPPPIPLRTGFQPRQRSHLERRERVLPARVWSAFKAQARQQRLTPTSALFAVYAEVVACWSGERHFLLNNMMTHRLPLHPEMKEVLGNFASLYPLEVDWRGNHPFAARARKLQVQLTSDMQHTSFSGVKVLQHLNQQQKTPGKAPCPFVVGSGLFMDPLPEPYFGCLETPQVLLDHQFWELQDGRLWVMWDVVEKAFPEGLLDDMWEAYLGLLTRLAENPEFWQHSSFDLLPESQRQQRTQLNQTRRPTPRGLLQDQLAQGAQRFPERLAVVTSQKTLTYAGLHRQSNQLGHALLQAGVRPGDRVAVLLPKGWEQVVAVHGILRAGAAYVPMDPAWPASRIEGLLHNTAASCVVTLQDLQNALPAGLPGVCLDDPALQHLPETAPTRVPQASNLAYILFTSGSTGSPKGVMVDHRGALNTILDINERFGIAEGDVVLGVSALHFDLSVWDIFGTLAAGATLVLPDASTLFNPAHWLELLRTHTVTVWNSVPALLQLLLDAAKTAGVALPSLKTVLLSGDWIPVTLPPQVQQVAPHAHMVSLGGATEASIWSIFHPIETLAEGQTSIPYGKPLSNQSWHVLDEQGRPAPNWVPGQLHIGGMGLALGYWQDAQRTSAAFVHHPDLKERLYRTGDLGRCLPDGSIEFLGRLDSQVKLQGLRIELGEIEHALLSHEKVHQAAVLLQEGKAGRHLLACVVPQQDETPPDRESLLQHLRSLLPAQMVPAGVVLLEQLPLTPNGKLDRKALSQREPTQPSEQQDPTPPRTPTEKALLQIWQEVLEVPVQSIHQDFFALGGQSFGAVKVMTRIEQQFGKRLPLGVLLESRTLARLALHLTETAPESSLRVKLNAETQGTPLFLVHPAGGQVLCYQGLAERLERPVYGIQAAGLQGQTPLNQLDQMAHRYLQEVREVQPHGPYLLGGWSSGAVIAFEMARQLEQLGEKVLQVISLDGPAPLQHDPIEDRSLPLWFLEDLGIGMQPDVIWPQELPAGPLHQQLACALHMLQERQGLTVDLDVQNLMQIFGIFRGVLEATRCYRPTAIQADLLVFRATSGMVSEFRDHPAGNRMEWGWSGLTHGKVRCQWVKGTHHTLLHPEHLPVLALLLKHHLNPEHPASLVGPGH